MKKFVIFAGLILLIARFGPAGAVHAGTISGKIKVNGLRSAANILVYLAKAPQTNVDLSGMRFTMDQRDLTFIPHVLPVPVGATVQFPNNDKVDHNVFSLSRAKKFNLGSYKPGQSLSIVFDKPGMVQLRCDVHAEMLAYIAVMKSPYFSVTDADGNFTIPDNRFFKSNGTAETPSLSAGNYRIKTWHEKLSSGSQTVEVPETGNAAVELNLKRGVPSVLYKR